MSTLILLVIFAAADPLLTLLVVESLGLSTDTEKEVFSGFSSTSKSEPMPIRVVLPSAKLESFSDVTLPVSPCPLSKFVVPPPDVRTLEISALIVGAPSVVPVDPNDVLILPVRGASFDSDLTVAPGMALIVAVVPKAFEVPIESVALVPEETFTVEV